MLFKKTTALFSLYGRRAVQSYDTALIEKPYVTKAITAFLIAGAADLSCQTSLQNRSIFCKDSVFTFGSSIETVDYSRLAVMALYAGIISSVVHQWLFFLSRFKSPAIRMFIDQMVFAPIGTATCIAVTATFLGDRSLLGREKFLSTWSDIIFANYAVWPLLQWINFSKIPLRYQILFSNVAGFFWTIFLSSRMFGGNDSRGGGRSGSVNGSILGRVLSIFPKSFIAPMTLFPSNLSDNWTKWPNWPVSIFSSMK